MTYNEVMIGLVIGGLVGALIGMARGRTMFGIALGVALGPVGWLIVLLFKDRRERCPKCKGVIPHGAVRCLHCGEDFFAKLMNKPKSSDVSPCPYCGTFMRTLRGLNRCPSCGNEFDHGSDLLDSSKSA